MIELSKNGHFLVSVGLVALLAAGGATAQIYKCVGPDGQLQFSDRKCTSDAEDVEVRGEFETEENSSRSSSLREGERKMLEEYHARRERMRQQQRYAAAILQNKIMVGMTESQVKASWGEPDEVNVSLSEVGRKEQWVYRRGNHNDQYVYIENGVMTGTN